ncbi:MAG: hypothetical protein E7588_05475 [Ruminococcaceae bacterium]|nr:hypothetical protein [Oscillospiraceae bacterium]
MKRMMIVLCFMLFITGCNKHTDISNPYIELANEYIASGEYTLAADVLQKGLEKENTKELSEKLTEVLRLQVEVEAENGKDQVDVNEEAFEPVVENEDVENYYYRNEDPSNKFISGEITIVPKDVYWEFGSLIANCYVLNGFSYKVNNITVDSLGFYNEDGYIAGGGCGILQGLSLEPFSYCEWAFTMPPECVVKPGAILKNGVDCEGSITHSAEYDLSKASGVLAKAGLSEQDFRNMCTPLLSSGYYAWNYNRVGSSKTHDYDRYVVANGEQYYASLEGDDTVQKAISKWDEICLDYETGGKRYYKSGQSGPYSYYDYHVYEKYGTLDSYLKDTVYAPKGCSIIYDYSKDIFEKMKEYPNEYLGTPFVLIDCDIESCGNNIYDSDNFVDTEIAINDIRDDVHSPNLITDNDYYLYVIFNGTYVCYDGDIGLKFSLLSLEKID